MEHFPALEDELSSLYKKTATIHNKKKHISKKPFSQL